MLANEDSVMLDHRRAREAHREVNVLTGPDSRQKFRSYALKAPSMLLSCGLGQTCAFLLAKEEKVFNALAKWLVRVAAWGTSVKFGHFMVREAFFQPCRLRA